MINHVYMQEAASAVSFLYAKIYFGMCGNDLLSHSYEQATDYYENYVNVYNWDENTEESEETGITTIDMLTREISLNFYHT